MIVRPSAEEESASPGGRGSGVEAFYASTKPAAWHELGRAGATA